MSADKPPGLRHGNIALGAWPRRLVRDPLFAFLLIGLAVFALQEFWRGDDSRTIVVSAAQQDRLAELWRAQTGRAPSPDELAALIEDHVREEILVREAKRLRLDDGDVIVRRRLAQKLSFLTEDVATLEAPGEDALLRYFEQNRSRYERPAVISFSHIYFSPDRRDDAGGDAERALAVLQPQAWRQTGDPFMLGRTYAHASLPRIRRDFGDAFAAQLQTLEVATHWQGPIQSGYGYHLLRVDAKTPALGADYASVAQRVAADFDADRRSEANRAHFEELRAQYRVELP